jgi:peptidoglycan/xylan/chitin deacetylase (PgdA/CDA1 family)
VDQRIGHLHTVYRLQLFKLLFLTYFKKDDGPTENTPAVLNYLAAQKITATFFVIGANVVKSDALKQNLKAIDAAGHQIALHSW